MAAREVRTPVNYTPAVELGNGIWWKQVLPADKRIKYGDRFIDFNEAYCRNVADAFGRKAFDTSPFVLAEESNSHTMAARAGQYGEVLAAKVDMDARHPETGEPAPGLYYALKLEPEANEIVQRNPKFGVSVRVKENYTRADGEHFDAACQHLLGTWDPVLTGLSPWQPFDGQVDLSNPPGIAVIDMSAITFQSANEEGADEMTAPQPTATATGQGDAPPPWFQQMVDSGQITVNTPTSDPADGTGDGSGGGTDLADGEFDIDGMDDDEFDSWMQDLVDGEQPAEVAASNGDDGAAVDLANSSDPRVVELATEVTTLRRQTAETRRDLAAERYERELVDLSHAAHLPPELIDRHFRPLLEGDGHMVDLANGTGTADAGAAVRGFLADLGHVFQVLDLSESQGQVLEPAADERQQAAENARSRGAQIAGMIPG